MAKRYNIVTLKLPVRSESPKALEVYAGSELMKSVFRPDATYTVAKWEWLPKSQIEYTDTGKRVSLPELSNRLPLYKIDVPTWLVEEKGLDEYVES